MLEKQFVEDLAANARVHSAFVVKSKSLAPFRNKSGQFMNLTLADCTGQILGRVWDNAEAIAEGFREGDVVVVTGSVQEYQGQLQLIATAISAAEPGSYELEDMIPRSGRPAQEMLGELDDLIGSVQDTDLKGLLETLFAEGPLRDRMAQAFGARSLHHAYAGGLLEHTLSVVKLLLATLELHPEMNRDLLVAGGLLHDVGKLEELDGVASVDYTDVGRFIGHTVLGDRLIHDTIRQTEGFNPRTADLLSHMILSHHGEREWGAPITPATMEACALHYADNLDARVQGFKQVIAAEAKGTGNWSSYHRSYERQIFLGPSSDPQTGNGGGQGDVVTDSSTARGQADGAQPPPGRLGL